MSMDIIYSPRCLEYAAPGHPESPARVRRAAARLEKSGCVWQSPEPCTTTDILRVHSPAVLEAVKTGNYQDADTPWFPNIDELARLAAGSALLAARQALKEGPALSLMRPPGHHAERDRIMGFCYFNNLAIAVAKVLADGVVQRVGILDFDCHHGNGTEDVFYGNDRVLFVSVHQSPCFPGTGLRSRGNCLNYPLPPHTAGPEFLAAVDRALDQLRGFDPQLLAISAGFDAYLGDPITSMGVEIDDYREIGRSIARFTHRPTELLPSFAVLEGGYANEMDRCVEAFVTGWTEGNDSQLAPTKDHRDGRDHLPKL
jgi:acetoin utilization deacetylase AcuC-like enzyme